MSITHSEILENAGYILASADCEAAYRNVIGRFYYAAFHSAQEFHDALPSPGMLPEKEGGSHEELIHRLRKPTVSDPTLRKKCIRMSYILKQLKEHRVTADYSLTDTLTSADAIVCHEQSKALKALI